MATKDKIDIQENHIEDDVRINADFKTPNKKGDNINPLNFSDFLKDNSENSSPSAIKLNDEADKFQDFIDLPKISGDIKGFENANKISGSRLVNTHNYINIKDVIVGYNDFSEKDQLKDHYSTIIINKDKAGNVVGIDVICKCGNKTRIDFDFAEGSDQEFKVSDELDIKLKDPGQDPAIINEDLEHHIYESAGDYTNDENYEEDLYKDLERKI